MNEEYDLKKANFIAVISSVRCDFLYCRFALLHFDLLPTVLSFVGDEYNL